MKHPLVFVATTPYAVNAFLRVHLITLAESHEVTLCVNTFAYPLGEEIAKVVTVHHIDIVRKISFWKDLCALMQLIRCFLAIQPATVHSMTPKAGLLAMLAAKLVGIRWRFHTFTGQVWANSVGHSRYILKMIDKLIVLCASQIFTDSESQCRFLEKEHVVRSGGATVLGHGSVAGVDLLRFRPDESSRLTFRREISVSITDIVFLFVGRLVRDKGVFDLVDAFGLVSIDFPSWELWMVGPNEDGLQAELEMRGRQIGARIRWFGSTTSPELYMASADVLVLPSYREGFGSVVIEAAASGIPSIAYRVNGVIDAIEDKLTGLLVDKGDISGLAQVMKRLGVEKELRKDLGEASLKRAEKDFSSLAVNAAWMDFYSEVLRKHV